MKLPEDDPADIGGLERYRSRLGPLTRPQVEPRSLAKLETPDMGRQTFCPKGSAIGPTFEASPKRNPPRHRYRLTPGLRGLS